MPDASYQYLVQMPIYNLTHEKKLELEATATHSQQEYDMLLGKQEVQIWREELEQLMDKYSPHLKKRTGQSVKSSRPTITGSHTVIRKKRKKKASLDASD